MRGLHLDVRRDLLFVRGVVDGRSRELMYEALKDAPEVRVIVLTSVPGSADDETNLALGRSGVGVPSVQSAGRRNRNERCGTR